MTARLSKSPQLLGADAQSVNDCGECISLLQPIFAKSPGQVVAEGGNVGRAARQQHSFYLCRLDASLVERSPDRLADQVQLGSDHRLESRSPQRHVQAEG